MRTSSPVKSLLNTCGAPPRSEPTPTGGAGRGGVGRKIPTRTPPPHSPIRNQRPENRKSLPPIRNPKSAFRNLSHLQDRKAASSPSSETSATPSTSSAPPTKTPSTSSTGSNSHTSSPGTSGIAGRLAARQPRFPRNPTRPSPAPVRDALPASWTSKPTPPSESEPPTPSSASPTPSNAPSEPPSPRGGGPGWGWPNRAPHE